LQRDTGNHHLQGSCEGEGITLPHTSQQSQQALLALDATLNSAALQRRIDRLHRQIITLQGES